MNDAEILYNNVKNICREDGILIGKVETDAGVCAGYLERLKHQGHAVKVSSVRKFARALGVPMLVLMEGMIE